jgi:tetrahydromethanopterin S-methyltransferase subunit B
MNKFKLVSLVALGLWVSSASAMDILIEPLVAGQFSGGLKESTSDSGSFTSVAYGGRLGLDFHGLLLGGEYLANNEMSVKMDGPNTWGSSSTTGKISNTNYGGFLGVELMHPLAIRLIGTFFAASSGHFTHETNGTIDADKTLKGYGYKGEISTRIAHYLSLGVSYYYLVFTKATDNMNNTTSTLSPVANQHAVMAQISIPLEL